MWEMSASWMEYYREPEPQRRRELLDTLCASEPDDGANGYRRQLFEARHADPGQPGMLVDRFLYCCMSFIQYSRNSRIFRGYAVRQVKRALKAMQFDGAKALGEAGEAALYWELRNAAARYFSCCEGPGYHRQMFGLIPSSEAGRRDRLCRDVWQMTRGVTRTTGLDEALAPWNRAVLDAYFALDGEARQRFEALDEKMCGGK